MIFQARSSGKRFSSSASAVPHRIQGGDGVGARRLVDRDRRGGAAVEARFAVEIGRAQFEPRDIAAIAAPNRPDWCG